jgi:hypothetical protein
MGIYIYLKNKKIYVRNFNLMKHQNLPRTHESKRQLVRVLTKLLEMFLVPKSFERVIKI